MKIRSRPHGVMGVAALLVSAGLAAANPIFTFTGITSNNAADVAAGEAQLRMEVIDIGPGANGHQVGFKFTNIGSLASSITDIYFDDGTLLGIAAITSGAGSAQQVSFTPGARPGNLPGGNALTPAFETTAGFSADSQSPAFHNGVNNTLNGSEWVTIIFDLKGGQGLASIMDAFTLGGVEGGLRVGLHVQGFDGGGSESFVNNGPPGSPPVIPLPGAAGLAAAGLLAIGVRRRRAH